MRFRFKCPLCNWLVWSSVLKKPVRLYFRTTVSNGRGQIGNPVVTPEPEWLYAFAERFYRVTQFLLDEGVVSVDRVAQIIQRSKTQQAETDGGEELETGATATTVEAFIRDKRSKQEDTIDKTPVERELEGEIEIDRSRDSEDS